MKGKSNIEKSLNKLEEKDVFSLLLFILYKLKDNKEYSTLSELVYVLDTENLFKFLSVFQGLTIKVPTIEELSSVIAALQMYQNINLDNMTMTDAVKEINLQDVSSVRVKEIYYDICAILDEYYGEND